MATVARGKALVAKLRGQAGVRDPEALAAHLGRFKKARKAGASVAEAKKIAEGGSKKRATPHGNRGAAGRAPESFRKPQADSGSEPKKKPSVFAKKPTVEDDDPFGEDFGDEPKTKEQLQQERMERQIIARMEKADRARVYAAIQEQGGLKTNDSLREEYAGIPNTFKRKDGLAGDEMADHLATYYPELDIRDERDLIDYLAA